MAQRRQWADGGPAVCNRTQVVQQSLAVSCRHLLGGPGDGLTIQFAVSTEGRDSQASSWFTAHDPRGDVCRLGQAGGTEAPAVTVNICPSESVYVADGACQAQSRASIQDGLDEGFYVGLSCPPAASMSPDLGLRCSPG